MDAVGADIPRDIGATVDQKGDVARLTNRDQDAGGGGQPVAVGLGHAKLEAGDIAAVEGVIEGGGESIGLECRRRDQVEAAGPARRIRRVTGHPFSMAAL